MIYFCADDYGLCDISSERIQHCIDKGALNKISVFPNFGQEVPHKAFENKNIRISLHLNLVEGKCMANACEIDLLADKDGNLKHTFGGLLKLSIIQGRRFEEQVYREIKAQVLYWKSILPQGADFCVDSHQHTHMIPAVFNALVKVIDEQKIDLHYMRIPAEPLTPYLKMPSLYITYSLKNLIKQWLLNFLWLSNRKQAKRYKIPSSYFFGILFSGKMDEKRVKKILPGYMKAAEKSGKDIEVLFHPGYLNGNEAVFENSNIVFHKFYMSENRKNEFDSVIKLHKGSVD